MRLLTRDEIRSRAPRTGWWLGMLAAAFFGLLFLFVWQKVRLTGQLARIECKQRALDALRTRQKTLAVEIQRLAYPGRLETVASAELGMVYPERDQMVVMITPPAPGSGQGLFAALFKPVNAAWSQP
ncbi:hypothetical protein EG831_02325 [bacterium]|nr:hypothetical protein [bacterium]